MIIPVLAQQSTDDAVSGGDVKGLERLKVLERKANERDSLAQRSKELEDELLQLQQRLDQGNGDARYRSSRGRLDMLERKAAQYEQVMLINEAKTQQIQLLDEENQQLRLAMDEMHQQYLDLLDKNTIQVASNQFLNATIKSLQQTVDQLLLGNFEYYEILSDNETLESIASLPMVYGDAKKASLLIQPNEKRVKNLEDLQVGDVLVIPRFPPSGRYLW